MDFTLWNKKQIPSGSIWRRMLRRECTRAGLFLVPKSLTVFPVIRHKRLFGEIASARGI